MSMEKLPLVSVIIPMYNSAKFISQTLESLLYQTIQDFEVVVVDDCSTDNSVEVVESFKPRFNLSGGQLHVIKLPKNTGRPGLPRNEGIKAARGKYIAFLDSDDLFTKTALEELTTLAEKYQAEAVRLQNNFVLWNGDKKSVEVPEFTDMEVLTDPKNFTVQSYYKEKLLEPTFEPENIAERVNRWLASEANAFWATCLVFYRREFLLNNQIFFPPMSTCEDASFTFEALCLAKNYLNAPNAVYIIRPRLGSISRDSKLISFKNHVHKRTRALIDGFKEFQSVMDKIDFFKENPNTRYSVLAWFADYRISITMNFYKKHDVFELNELLKKEFSTNDADISLYFFNALNLCKRQIKELKAANKKLKAANKKLKLENQKLKNS